MEDTGTIHGAAYSQHAHRSTGSPVLAVAHADFIQNPFCFSAVKTAQETLVFCPRLDDRLGVYTILDLLPALGVHLDVLITDNEETGSTTAADFQTDINYSWMVGFDRRGTGAVTYGYHWTGEEPEQYFSTSHGTFSDISELEHLGCKGLNVGVGYHNEHTERHYFSVEEYVDQIARFILFWYDNRETHFPHTRVESRSRTLWTPDELDDWANDYDDKRRWFRHSASAVPTSSTIDGRIIYECSNCGGHFDELDTIAHGTKIWCPSCSIELEISER